MTGGLVFIGDSLTQWCDWDQRLPGRRVANLGISGERIEELLGRREAIRRLAAGPDYIFLMTGINDIASEHYDITDPYREFVRSLATWHKKSRIVVQSILPVELVWISNDVIREINRRLQGIAAEYQADYLDLYRLFVNKEGRPKPGLLQDDGVHLTTKGYDVWAGEVRRFLKQAGEAEHPPER